MKKPTKFTPTLAEAFEVGKREGLREAFEEIKTMIPKQESQLKTYLEARLKSILDFSSNNPFKQKD